MNCERCRRRPAAVKYIEVEDGVKRTRWLCEECATEEGAAPPPPAASDTGVNLQAFLGESPAAADPDRPDPAPCPQCGGGVDQLQDTGLLGCPRCYEHFRDLVVPLVRRYHRASVHLGKAPRARGPRAARRLELAQLRSALEAAVAAEDFEEAARLRDRAAKLQDELRSTGEPAAGEDA
jgi:protein arginine kinase activator